MLHTAPEDAAVSFRQSGAPSGRSPRVLNHYALAVAEYDSSSPLPFTFIRGFESQWHCGQ